jgi:bifunctional ADP-heptose synthase (sugar kinase/adenylyltransferase)
VDTRTKIVPTQQAADIAASGAVVVSGYFDPMLAWHASRLQELKRKNAPLLVLIAASERPILSARARAELLAGLKAVDYVCEVTDGIAPQFRLEEEDAHRLKELIARVHARNA